MNTNLKMLLSSLFLLTPSLADDAPIRVHKRSPRVQMVVLAPDLDVAKLKSPNYDVIPAKDFDVREQVLLPVPVRDALLEEIGLGEEVQSFDQSDRDLLLWHLAYHGAEIAHEKYPGISVAKLKAARSKF